MTELLRILEEVLRTLEEHEQHEEFVLKIVKLQAVRALQRNLAVRALMVKHLACERAS